MRTTIRSSDTKDLTPNGKLGPNEILSLPGEGVKGEVCKARDMRLDRKAEG